jgi:hypothetical protein
MLGEYHDGIDGNIFSKHNDQEKKTFVKRIFYSNFSFSISSCNYLALKRIPSVLMYAMNIQNDVIGLVLREHCKSKQVNDFIA